MNPKSYKNGFPGKTVLMGENVLIINGVIMYLVTGFNAHSSKRIHDYFCHPDLKKKLVAEVIAIAEEHITILLFKNECSE